ncbi:hypothetical protein [Micromonospora sp. NPDC049662]|uniref:hypothetical protein n=1 Tax=Micromonospora sp. NPDC049662 TaxID=3155397 RepID=UPI0034417E59
MSGSAVESEAIDLVVPNIADFNLRHPRLTVDPATHDSFVRVGQAFAEQSLFWSLGRRVLVLPAMPDRQWFADVHIAMGASPPPLIHPVQRSGLLVRDLLDDAIAMSALRRELDGHRTVRLVTWGATQELYTLQSVLTQLGHDVVTDLPAPEHYWASLYLDSKMSCLDLASQLSGFRVAPGITVDSWVELRGAIDSMLSTGEAVIVRSMYGVSGEGSTVVHANAESRSRFWRTVRDDPLLSIFPLSVQRYVTHQPAVGCPAVDLFIGDEGVTSLLSSIMTVDEHRFTGVNVGAGLLPSAVEEEMHAVSTQIAGVARGLGFRGWFGVDFLMSADGDLYVTEFNARRTGGSEWVDLLARWRATPEVVVRAEPAVSVTGDRHASYAEVRSAIDEVRRDGVPVFPTNVRGLGYLRRSYGIVTGGADGGEAERRATLVRRTIEVELAGPRIVALPVSS